jgi:hypothetical protein
MIGDFYYISFFGHLHGSRAHLAGACVAHSILTGRLLPDAFFLEQERLLVVHVVAAEPVN